MNLGDFLIGVQLNANAALQGLDKLKNGLNSVKSNAEQMQKAFNAVGQSTNTSTNAFINQQKTLEKLSDIKEKIIKNNKEIAKSESRIKGLESIAKQEGWDAEEYKYIDQQIAKTQELKKQTQELSKEQQNCQQQFKKTAQEIKNNDKEIKKHTESIHEQASAYRTLSLYAVAAFAGIVTAIKKASDAYSQYNAAMSGLKALAIGTGNSFSKLQKDLEEYTEDGLIPAAEAATALKNLLARGYTDTQAIEILERLKDSAAYNRQAALSMGQAIAGATEGLKNENSILVDNAGVTKNVSKMWEEYADSIGKTKNELTLQEKIQAEYNGIMKETSYFEGNATRYAKEYAGQLAKTGASVRVLKQNFGEALAPTLQYLNEVLFEHISKLSIFIKENETLVNTLTFVTLSIVAMVAVITTAKAASLTLAAAVKVLGDALGMTNATLLTLAINPVVILFTALAAAVGLATVKNAEYNKTLKERNKQEEEEIKILEEINRLKREGIALDEKDTYQDKVTKSRYYLLQYDKINQKIQDLAFWVYSFDKKEIRLMDEGEKIRLRQAKEELKELNEKLNNIIEAAGDDGIDLTSKQAIANTRTLTNEEEKQLDITKKLDTETSKNRIKEIANTQSSIQVVKNLVETYKKAQKGTSDWIEAEEKLAELYPEFSTLSGIKITAIENEIEAKEKQTKADWTAFKQEAKITTERLKAMTTEEKITKNLINIKALEARIRTGDTAAYQEIQEALKIRNDIKNAKEAIKYYEEIANMDINEIPGYKPVRKADDKTSAEKTAYQKAIELYEHRKNLGKLTLQDEIKVLEDIKKAHARTTEEIWDAEERIYSAKTALSDSILAGYEKDYNAQVKTSERWVKQQKGYNKLTEQQEIDAYNRMIAFKKDYIKKILTDENITSDKKIEIKEREMDAIEDLELEIFNIQKENIKKTLKLQEDYLDDYDNQLDRWINRQKLRNNITGDQEIANYNKQLKEHLKYLDEIDTMEGLSSEEKIKMKKEEQQKIEDIEDKIYSTRKEYIDKALEDYIQSLEDEIDASEKAAIKKLQDEKDAIKEKYEQENEDEEHRKRMDKLAKLQKRERLYQNAATKDGLKELADIRKEIQDIQDAEDKQRREDKRDEELAGLDIKKKKTEEKYDIMRKNLKTLRTDMENEAFELADNINVNLTNVQQTIADKSIEIFKNTDSNLNTLLKNIQDKVDQMNSLKSDLSTGSVSNISNVKKATEQIPVQYPLTWEDYKKQQELTKKEANPYNAFIYNDYSNKTFNDADDVKNYEEEIVEYAKAKLTK